MRPKHILTWLRRTRIQSAVRRVSYNITQKLWHLSGQYPIWLWETPLWFPRKSAWFSQHTGRDPGSNTQIEDVCVFTKQNAELFFFSTRVVQKWGKWKHSIPKRRDRQPQILRGDRGSTRPGFQRWIRGSGSEGSPSPLCPSPQEHSSALPEGEELSGFPWKERWGTGNQTCR